MRADGRGMSEEEYRWWDEGGRVRKQRCGVEEEG